MESNIENETVKDRIRSINKKYNRLLVLGVSFSVLIGAVIIGASVAVASTTGIAVDTAITASGALGVSGVFAGTGATASVVLSKVLKKKKVNKVKEASSVEDNDRQIENALGMSREQNDRELKEIRNKVLTVTSTSSLKQPEVVFDPKEEKIESASISEKTIEIKKESDDRGVVEEIEKAFEVSCAKLNVLKVNELPSDFQKRYKEIRNAINSIHLAYANQNKPSAELIENAKKSLLEFDNFVENTLYNRGNSR